MTVPLLAYTQAEAAEALGLSRAAFREHVLPELRVIRRGRRTLIPVREIERWIEDNGESIAEEYRRRRA